MVCSIYTCLIMHGISFGLASFGVGGCIQPYMCVYTCVFSECVGLARMGRMGGRMGAIHLEKGGCACT